MNNTAQLIGSARLEADTLREDLDATQDTLRRVVAQRDKLQDAAAIIRRAYPIVADIGNQWPGRHTAQGQALLVAMRDIAMQGEDDAIPFPFTEAA